MQKSSTGEYQNLLRGLSVQDLTPELINRLNLPKRIKGVVVTDIGEDSPAVMALTQGDVIQEINRQKVTNVKEYENIASKLRPEEDILLLIYRNGSSIFITLSGK
jgi:S1-C subfamily serine protease